MDGHLGRATTRQRRFGRLSRAAVAGALVVMLATSGTTTVFADGPTGWTAGLSSANLSVGTDQAQVAALARTFQMAVRAHDGDGLVTLLHPSPIVKERNAVVAAGAAPVAHWVQACVARRFTLDPSSLHLEEQGASWVFSDASGCYERTRPGVFGVGRDLGPAGGVLEMAVQGGKIAQLTFTYSRAWEARRLASMAAPVRAAQEEEARRALQPAPPVAPLPLDDREVPSSRVPSPTDTQHRTTPSPLPWIGVTVFTTVIGALAGLKRPTFV